MDDDEDDYDAVNHMIETHNIEFHKKFSQCYCCGLYIINNAVTDHFEQNHPEFYQREILPVLRGGMRF